jgi:hypothetical protein
MTYGSAGRSPAYVAAEKDMKVIFLDIDGDLNCKRRSILEVSVRG